MLNLLTDQAQSSSVRTMKSLAIVIWLMPFALMFSLALILGALGNMVGLSGNEIALDFLADAAGLGLLIPAKFSLTLLFLAALHFGFCWDSTGVSAHNLAVRLSSLMMECVKLWSPAVVRNYILHYESPNDPNRRSLPNKRTAIEGTSYLEGVSKVMNMY